MKSVLIPLCFSLGSMFQFTSDLTTDKIQTSGIRKNLPGEDITTITKPQIDTPPLSTGSGPGLRSSQVLEVIRQSRDDRRPVLRVSTGTVIIQGPSNTDLLCGKCNSVLARGIGAEQLFNVVLYCNYCGSLNDTENYTTVRKPTLSRSSDEPDSALINKLDSREAESNTVN